MLSTAPDEVKRVLAEATDPMGGDRDRSVEWFHQHPLAGFEGQTAEELVAAGHADAVLTHLRLLRGGGNA